MESKGKIYLATSDEVSLEVLRSVLEPAGHRLQEPMDKGMVAEEAGIFGADLVILGTEKDISPARALQRIREGGPPDPSVLVLAGDPEGDAGRWLDAGADDVIRPPLDPRVLANRVELLLSLRAKATSADNLPALSYSSIDMDDEAPRPTGIPRHLPPGLDGYYEPDMATLIEVSEAYASSLAAEDALFVIVKRLAGTIPVSRCNVIVLGVNRDQGVVVASHDDANLKSRDIKLSRYPEVRRCLDGGELVLIEDVHQDPDMREVLDFIKSVDLRSALVLPLYVKEVAVGALSLTSRREAHGFTQRELIFTRAMANAAAGVIASGDLIERIRRGEGEEPEIVDFEEVFLGVDDAIEGLIEELERK